MRSAVRTGMLFSSPAGNNLLYDEKLIEQGRISLIKSGMPSDSLKVGKWIKH